MRHLAIPLPHLHSAALAVALRGGPAYEGPREGGLTHFLEHVLFRGAGPYPRARELLAVFEDLGGEPEAYTGEDLLVLLMDLDPARLEEAAQLLRTVLCEPRYDQLEAERQVILEERLEGVDEDGQSIDPDDLSRALAFGGHPLGRSILGRKRDIETRTREELEAWRRRLVVNENLAVVVAGPLEPARVEAALAPLRELPAGPAPTPHPAPPAQARLQKRFQRAEGAQVELRFSFRAPGLRHAQAPTLQVLVDLLDGGPTARVPERLSDSGLAYDAQAGLLALPEVSLLELDLAVARPKAARAMQACLELCSQLCAAPPDAAELERVALRRRHRQRQRRDDARGQAEWAARRLLRGLPHDHVALDAAEAAVSPADLQALARQLFHPAGLSLLALGRLSGGQRKGLGRTLEGWRPASLGSARAGA